MAIPANGKGDATTVKALQAFFGLTQDGFIGNQNKTYIKKYVPALTAVTYGRGGSKLVAKLQEWAGASKPYDGVWGVNTSKAIQRKLVALKYFPANEYIDGVAGAKTFYALQECINNNGGVNPNPQPTPTPSVVERELSACKTQADWMKNAKYGAWKPVTIEHSKVGGTCVTYVGCVLQRIGYLKSGEYIWHNGSGYGTGKVYGTNSKMTTTYMNNKTFKALKSQLRAGDIILCDDNKSGDKGGGGHIMILSHFSGDTPYIWDVNKKMECERSGKVHSYSNTHKILAVVRLK